MITVRRSHRIFVDVVWWGWSQAHKWRWNTTHIDLGPVSVYNLRRLWFWQLVATLVSPLRARYHSNLKERKDG